ncbi:single-stranded DNA-binding protein [Natronolimnohabitans sp. A-GB9]|uniref:single-stranded DNA-binding protein n=1 Tax=Natronolimnohabitans sp. A-GB9 TaxID=3069757 RepID=UPI0027B00237|nr:single-stranded DNA-binding protein [Natronolimnohabitans sp. A-GB9]MDQ2050582.1 single-stranded DNA-binding protein [Natronolimnohabitans sp. A-GB9]
MSLASYDLHERLDRLSSAAADRDILVSLAVPPEQSIGEARQPVETDYAEASQPDEQSFPEPLTDAVETVRSELHEYEEIPDNGLAIYAGAPDGDLVTAVFDDLPVPIEESIYRHGNEFDLEPLEDVTEPESTHGLLVVERGGAALGVLDDEGVEPTDTLESDVPGKSSAGGQSAERSFLGDEPVDSVLLGGTTGAVETFREEADLDHRLEDRIVGEFAVEYATQQGLEQLAETGQEAIEERDRERVRESLEAFFDRVGDDDEPVVYGRDDVDDALEFDAVETLLLSTALEGDTLQKFGERTERQGGETVVVPDDFPDGSWFATAFDGIGALLRFPID